MRKLTILIATAVLFTILGSHPVSAQSKKIFGTITVQERERQIFFSNGRLQLIFSKSTGNLLTVRSSNNTTYVHSGDTASADVLINGKWLADRPSVEYHKHSVSTDPRLKRVTLSVTQQLEKGNYLLTTSYSMYPYKALAERSSVVLKKSGRRDKFSGFRFSWPALQAGKTQDCSVNVPGPFWPFNFTPAGTPYDSLLNSKKNYHQAPDGSFGVFSITNNKDSITLTTFIRTNGDAGYSTSIIAGNAHVTVMQQNNKAAYLAAGHTLYSDTQQLVVTKTFSEALAIYRQQASSRMPLAAGTPSWTKESVILEVFPEYFKEGFAGLEKKLPFYRDIGFNTIYLMPHWKGGYSPIDLYQVNPEYGTKESLQQLVHAAHALGMKVLFDMVIHGFNRSSAVIRNHPDFFYRDDNDTLMIHPAWGSVMTDFMDTSYRRYMQDYVLYEQHTYGVDGYRVDAASYKGPNWNRKIRYPAYQSGSSSPELIRDMLEAMKVKNRDAVMLSEVFGPVFYTVSNFVHDNQTEALSFLIKQIDSNQYPISRYQLHLQQVYKALPQGATRVFYSRNHDTSWFYKFFGYTPTFMSLEAIHAFFGVPEVFAGDRDYPMNPDDNPSTYATYKKLFSARKKYPELMHGEIILENVHSGNEDVFSGLRRTAGNTCLVLVSGSKEKERVAVRLPEGIVCPESVKAEDIIMEKSVNATRDQERLVLTLDPYQVVLVRF